MYMKREIIQKMLQSFNSNSETLTGPRTSCHFQWFLAKFLLKTPLHKAITMRT